MPDYPSPVDVALFSAPDGGLAALDEALAEPGDAGEGESQCPQATWGLTEITLNSAGRSSQSQDDPAHAALPGGAAVGFFFAPKTDTVSIDWKLKNAPLATTLTLELFRAGSPAPFWTLTLDAGATKALSMDWDEALAQGTWLEPGAFPDSLVTVEHSPYMLKATAGPGAESGLVKRWTYAAVIVERIVLTWGGKALIPAGAPADVDAFFQAQTQQQEQDLNDALAAQVLADGSLDPGVPHPVRLPSNQFTTYSTDMYDDSQTRKSTLWLNHRKQWGDGPRIPLVAKVFVARAGGGGVQGGETAKALGQARFLWDWESDDEIAGLGAAGHHANVNAFLTDSLEYRRNDGEGPPGSTNCHEDHGGKRGGAKKVLGALPAASPHTQLGAVRKWACFAQAVLVGPEAGQVGIVFQPSRIAGDNYKVSVTAPPDAGAGGWAALDLAVAASQLRTDHPGLPVAASGHFHVTRKVDMHYVRKSAAVGPAALASISQEYRRAGLELDWSANQAQNEADLAANFHAWFTQALNHPDQKGQGKVVPVRQWFEPNDQLQAGTGADTTFGFIARSWEAIDQDLKVNSIREYVQKARVFNTPNKRYTAWLGQPGNGVATDSTWLLNFYAGLSQTKKAKVDVIHVAKRTALKLSTKSAYEDGMTGAAVELARLVAEQMLLHINQHGMVVFHVEAPMAYRQIDDSIVVPNSAQGGMSPSSSAKWGGRGAVHMVFLPQVPSADPQAKYHEPVTDVIKHEAGHNLFLCHAYTNVGVAQPSRTMHDIVEPSCLMSYDPAFDHLCGYCHLKLRGWITVGKNGGAPEAGVKLHNVAAQNRQP